MEGYYVELVNNISGSRDHRRHTRIVRSRGHRDQYRVRSVRPFYCIGSCWIFYRTETDRVI